MRGGLEPYIPGEKPPNDGDVTAGVFQLFVLFSILWIINVGYNIALSFFDYKIFGYSIFLIFSATSIILLGGLLFDFLKKASMPRLIAYVEFSVALIVGAYAVISEAEIVSKVFSGISAIITLSDSIQKLRTSQNMDGVR